MLEAGPGAVPVVRWPGGASLLRIVSQAGFDRWVLPLTGPGHLSSDPSLLFVYLDDVGIPAAAMLLERSESGALEVVDAMGAHSGRMSPKVSAHLLGLITGPFDTLTTLRDWSQRLPFGLPVFLLGSYLKKKRRQEAFLIPPVSLPTVKDREAVARKLESAYKVLMRRLGFSGRLLNSSEDQPGAQSQWSEYVWKTPSTWHLGDLQLVIRVGADGSDQYRLEHIRLGHPTKDEVLAVLGQSALGPIDVVEASGLLWPKSKKEQWLEEHTAKDWQFLVPVQSYMLLGLPSPLTWPAADLVRTFGSGTVL